LLCANRADISAQELLPMLGLCQDGRQRFASRDDNNEMAPKSPIFAPKIAFAAAVEGAWRVDFAL